MGLAVSSVVIIRANKDGAPAGGGVGNVINEVQSFEDAKAYLVSEATEGDYGLAAVGGEYLLVPLSDSGDMLHGTRRVRLESGGVQAVEQEVL